MILLNSSHAQTANEILNRSKANNLLKSEDQIIDNSNLNQQGVGFGTGTGFYIDNEGLLITAAHVVKNCLPNTIRVRGFDKNIFKADKLTVDTTNDLALIRVLNVKTKPLKLNLSPQLGEDAYAFGYPLFGELAQSGNFTAGIVTSLSGYKEDTTRFQISAPIQSGNSGGPVFDQKGNVIGVVLQKSNATSSEIIQNVNFAVRSRLIEIFLSSNGIKIDLSKDDEPLLKKTEIASRGQSSSVLVYCETPNQKKKENLN